MDIVVDVVVVVIINALKTLSLQRSVNDLPIPSH
jgi:hypothetical protein